MNNLAIQERVLKAIAKDFPCETLDERRARAALVAVVIAIHNHSLDRLLTAIIPYLQEEVGWTDALTDGEMFDLLSHALNDLEPIGMAEQDEWSVFDGEK